MTAAEYRAALAAGKLKPASEQKRKAVKRSALEKAATVRETGAGVKLVEVRIPFPGVGDEIHWTNPAYPEMIAHWRGEAEKQQQP